MGKPTALTIGANGFLGTYAVRAAANIFEVFRGVRCASDPKSVSIDISDVASVNKAFEFSRPDAVILLAAMSDIDRCELHPDQAFAINVRGVENVVNACVKTKARLVFTSTAAVFDGRKRGYSEDDPVSPLSVYGTTKVRAESVIQTLLPGAVIVRPSLVLGFSPRPNTNSLVNTLIERWRLGQSVHLPTFEFRNPIHVESFAQVLVTFLANTSLTGIYHVGACDSISRYDLGKRLASRGGFPDNLVRPQQHAPSNRAPRGEHHFLLTQKFNALHAVPKQSCDDAIERCFA